MFVPDDRFPQIAGIRADQAVPVESAASGGNSGSSTPAQRAAAQSAEASRLQQHRPLGICRAVSSGSWRTGRFENLKPETVLRWHRAGFRAYWRWKSRAHGGRPKTPLEIRQLIRDMSIANPFWGAP